MRISFVLLISAAVVCTSAAPAHACFQSSGYDTATFINGAVDYLICLHNEQVVSMNDLADIINSNGDRMDTIAQAVLTQDENGYRAALRIEQLEARITELERRIDALADAAD